MGSGYLHPPGEHEEEEVTISDPLAPSVFSDIPVSHLD